MHECHQLHDERSHISGVYASIEFTIMSDLGMAFELGIKGLMQGLSPMPDGARQVLGVHGLNDLWDDELFSNGVKDEINTNAQDWAQSRWHKIGTDGWDAKRFLPFDTYLARHPVLSKTVENRYATYELGLEGLFVTNLLFSYQHVSVVGEGEHRKEHYDGSLVCVSYWKAILDEAVGHRYPEDREDLKDEKKKVLDLMDDSVESWLKAR